MRWFNKNNFRAAEEAFHRRGLKLTVFFGIAMALLVALLVISVIRDNSENASLNKGAYLVYADYSQSKVILRDAEGREISKSDFPYPSSYVRYEATSPNGAVLLSVGTDTPNETFFFLNQREKIDITKEVSQKLASAVKVDAQHNMAFIGEDSLVFTACPAAENCKLFKLNFKTGKTEELVDTGVAGAAFTPAYLLGSSKDNKSVYLRVSGKNKLSSDSSAVYKIDLTTKKATAIKVPIEAGLNMALSPDEKTLVYKTGGLGQPIEFKLVDTATGKESKVTWEKAEISNSATAFRWSPDSRRVLFSSSSSIAKATASKDNPIKLAYLDVKENKIIDLQTISKTHLNYLLHYNWLGADDVIYGQAVGAKENDPNPKKEIYKLPISSKKPTKVEASALLEQVVFY